MMKKIVWVLVLFIFSGFANNLLAQVNNKVEAAVTKKIIVPDAKPGNYQIIYHPSKIKYQFAKETLKKIEESRDKKIVKYLWLKPTVEVKILPKEYIESSDFVPLTEELYVDH